MATLFTYTCRMKHKLIGAQPVSLTQIQLKCFNNQVMCGKKGSVMLAINNTCTSIRGTS